MKRIIGISFVILAVTLFSCQNDKVDIPVDDGLFEKSAQITLTEVQLEAAANEVEYEVEYYANAEQVLTRWWNMGQVLSWSNKLRYQMNHCPKFEMENGEDNGFPKTITLDYGTGTELKNGKVLSGEIIIEISAPRQSKDYTRFVTFNSFGVDSITISGTSADTVDWTEEVFRNHTSELIFKKDSGEEIYREANRNWTWVEGLETTEDQTDDVIHIEGTVTATMGTDTYVKDIIVPLVRRKDCRFIVSGVVAVYLNGNTEPISTMNYGDDGICDNIAIMSTSEGDTEIDLAEHKMKGEQNQYRKQNGGMAGKQNGGMGGNQNGNHNGNQNGGQNGNGNGNG